MRIKESVLLALKLARKEKSTLVVGREEERWLILPLADARSDSLADGIIITPKGLRYPEDEYKIAELSSQGL